MFYLFVVDTHGTNLVFVVLGAVVEPHFRIFLGFQLRQLLLTVLLLLCCTKEQAKHLLHLSTIQ